MCVCVLKQEVLLLLQLQLQSLSFFTCICRTNSNHTCDPFSTNEDVANQFIILLFNHCADRLFS